MENFWIGFEKRAGKGKVVKDVVKAVAKKVSKTAPKAAAKPAAEGFFGGLKRMGGEAVSAAGSGMDNAGKWVSEQAGHLNKKLPERVSNFGQGVINKVKANPFKSALGATGVGYAAGKASSPSQPQSPQYNNYVM